MRDCCKKSENHGPWKPTGEEDEFMWVCQACDAKHIVVRLNPGSLGITLTQM
jgi:hypothetical protein